MIVTKEFVVYAVGVPLGIFTGFIAIRLWSYAYFKSKWEQWSSKVNAFSRKL
jgi:hypothetical protein